MRVLSIVGNRPQFIKSAALSLALRERTEEIVLHTGQHYDSELSQIFFDELGLPPPDHRIESGSGSHAEQLAQMLPGIEQIARAEQPDWVLVYGDTNSTLAGALATAKLGLPIAHVEAGLRSFDPSMPEEINRIVVDRLSQLLLCPTQVAVRNLAGEGVTTGVHVVGDVMLELALRLAPLARERSQALGWARVLPGRYLLLTLHREANVQPANLTAIVAALNRLSEPVVFPAHPRTREALERTGLELEPQITLLPPLGYLDFAALASQARLVLTDSGGVQKEAYWYEVPCITLRTTTEWVETLASGWNRLVGADSEAIVAAVETAVRPSDHPPLYGDGTASQLIAELLCTMSR